MFSNRKNNSESSSKIIVISSLFYFIYLIILYITVSPGHNSGQAYEATNGSVNEVTGLSAKMVGDKVYPLCFLFLCRNLFPSMLLVMNVFDVHILLFLRDF